MACKHGLIPGKHRLQRSRRSAVFEKEVDARVKAEACQGDVQTAMSAVTAELESQVKELQAKLHAQTEEAARLEQSLATNKTDAVAAEETLTAVRCELESATSALEAQRVNSEQERTRRFTFEALLEVDSRVTIGSFVFTPLGNHNHSVSDERKSG